MQLYTNQVDDKWFDIIFPINGTFAQYNIDDATITKLVKKYNSYTIYSCIISHNELSFDVDDFECFFNYSKCCFYYLFSKLSEYNESNGCLFKLLFITEYNHTRGYHNHVLLFNATSNITLAEVKRIFNSYMPGLQHHTSENGFLPGLNMNSMQKIKSSASYINYVKKGPLFLIASDLEVLQMYVHFDKNIIFNPNTFARVNPMPLTNHHVRAKDECVTFMLECIRRGANSFDDILQHPMAMIFLQKPNLQTIYRNVFSFFIANRSIKDCYEEIFTEFLKMPVINRCFCPVVEMLKYQRVDIQTFIQQILTWIQCKTKQNALVFYGPTNTGKSVFAGLLHSLFRYSNRLTPDGIFTFANCINADCVLWEEPLITPDNVDTVKTVIEGNPKALVAIKGKDPVELKRKVPFIITTNHPLYMYCTNEQGPLNSRTTAVYFGKNMEDISYCDDNDGIHECGFLEGQLKSLRSVPEATASTSQEYQRVESEAGSIKRLKINDENLVLSCDIHRLKRHHMLSFITYILIRCKENIDIPRDVITADFCHFHEI